MAKSKNHKDHKQKVNQFKNKIMAQNQAQKVEKTHLVPQPEWQSTENLDARGDLMEVMDQALVQVYSALQRAGQAFQAMIGENIKNNKVKIKYVWNDGSPASESEVSDYQKHMDSIREMQQAQAKQQSAEGVKEQQPGAALLVDAHGRELKSEKSEVVLDNGLISL